jgi:5-methyltetrahydrofolate--homocysteine methyltransferase
MKTREMLDRLAVEKIIILDGAMGSMIQAFRSSSGDPLAEADFRGEIFADHKTSHKGCNDILCLTRPDVITGIHEAYLRAGADIIETCSFNSTAISLADYGVQDRAYEISAAAAALARKAADNFSVPARPRFVAGSMGPSSKSAGISLDMNDPARRVISWDELEVAYYDNARGLLDGGADMFLVETIVDSINAKAAILAINRLLDERHIDVPLMISASVANAGRLLTGQTLEAFCVSVLHAKPWSIGLNCSFGAERLKPHLRELSAFVPCFVSAYPNAGMPNQLGEYDDTPESMASSIEGYLQEGLVNILGGCCGSTPAHIAAIAARARNYPPRTVVGRKGRTFLAGTKSLVVGDNPGLTFIGERTNVAGSRKFLRLIKEENYDDALDIARDMVESGAAVIDICMDDALLDSAAAMKHFINLAVCFSDVAELPVMIDSSRWEVIEEGLKCLPGKGLVNSISLKEGVEEFLRKAHLARACGAAVVVMLFDEQGQAVSYERKIEIAARSWSLLTNAGFPPEDIVFDPNVLAVATGIPEHDSCAVDFIHACTWIKKNCPGCQISGGISNLSFSFRGNNKVREAMHTVFLKHAADAGLSMAIVNPASLVSYDDIDAELRQAAEDVILNRGKGGAERLLAIASSSPDTPPSQSSQASSTEWRQLPAAERMVHAMIHGIETYVEEDVRELRKLFSRALDIVEGPLMLGMREVGDRFGAGKMFLPQVIRTARVMKKAVAVLNPYIEEEKSRLAGSAEGEEEQKTGKILLATVKGDVHDIGKNIVGSVLGCSGYDITDLGVMVPAKQILEKALEEKVDIIGLSGLITPSLDEMIHVAREMEKQEFTIPLLIGGAATSLAHTALRIAPEYSGPVVYVADASQCPPTVRSLLLDRIHFVEELTRTYKAALERHKSIHSKIELVPLEEARKNRAPLILPGEREKIPLDLPAIFDLPPGPAAKKSPHIMVFKDYPLDRVIPYVDWRSFLQTWDLAEQTYPTAYSTLKYGREQKDAAEKLLKDGKNLLEDVAAKKLLHLRGAVGFFPACSRGDDVVLFEPPEAPGTGELARFCFPRNQEKKRMGGPNPCLSDFIVPGTGPTDRIGLFVLSAGFGLKNAKEIYESAHDDYSALILASLANVLAEAFSEEVHLRLKRAWGDSGIRPAFGYPACPDHQDKRIVFELLDAKNQCGLELTESAMIIPAASVCGLYFSRPISYYFGIGILDDDQVLDWAGRKGITMEEARLRLGRI